MMDGHILELQNWAQFNGIKNLGTGRTLFSITKILIWTA